MSATTRTTYCPACKHDVQVTVLDPPLHGDQSTLHDAGEMVCLDFGSQCDSDRCPLSNMPRVVMGLRLARSGLGDDRLEHVRAVCDTCEQAVVMSMIDQKLGVCGECGAINHVIVLEVEDEGALAIAMRAMIAER